MRIENYVDYFHDGFVIDIKHLGHDMTIDMSSAEMDPADLVDDVILSREDTITGRLHILGIESIHINDQPFHSKLEKNYDNGSINRFFFNNKNISLQVSWENYPPKPRLETDLFEINIKASCIYWENIPNLID